MKSTSGYQNSKTNLLCENNNKEEEEDISPKK